jgi:pimeloyl-ACP methyl ester carboxylesterase
MASVPEEAADVVVPAGARRPDRRRTVSSSGVAISVAEWGPPGAPPVLFAHGGFDFAETLNVFAPMLVDAGYRVVSWDQRGHGLSEWTALYSWDADTRDGAAVLATLGDDPVPLIGHSKGGTLALHLADALPHRVSHVVNLDGLPSQRNAPDIADHERSKLLAGELAGWLTHRRGIDGRERKPGTIDELATRRGRMNPRLTHEWLRYLVSVGAREDTDGWRWRLDPILRPGGFGPWRPEWSMRRVPALGMPFLGVLGLELEEMGWGTRPSDVVAYLPPGARFEALEGVGHFVHIEQPRRIADMVLDLLAEPRR